MKITKRERDVMRLLVSGLTNKQIRRLGGQQLHCSLAMTAQFTVLTVLWCIRS